MKKQFYETGSSSKCQQNGIVPRTGISIRQFQALGIWQLLAKTTAHCHLSFFDRKFLNAPLHCDTRSFARKSYLHTDPAEFLSLCHFITSHDITGHLKIILYLIIGDALSQSSGQQLIYGHVAFKLVKHVVGRQEAEIGDIIGEFCELIGNDMD